MYYLCSIIRGDNFARRNNGRPNAQCCSDCGQPIGFVQGAVIQYSHAKKPSQLLRMYRYCDPLSKYSIQLSVTRFPRLRTRPRDISKRSGWVGKPATVPFARCSEIQDLGNTRCMLLMSSWMLYFVDSRPCLGIRRVSISPY